MAKTVLIEASARLETEVNGAFICLNDSFFVSCKKYDRKKRGVFTFWLGRIPRRWL